MNVRQLRKRKPPSVPAQLQGHLRRAMLRLLTAQQGRIAYTPAGWKLVARVANEWCDRNPDWPGPNFREVTP